LAAFSSGKKFIEESDCKACHLVDKKSIGPMFMEVSNKYKDDPKAVEYLSDKIINGGNGVWGEVAMAAHPQLAKSDAQEMVRYILSLGDKQTKKSLPSKGTFTATVPEGNNNGVYILRAAYTDRGANGLPPLLSEQVMVLRNPSIPAAIADTTDSVMKYALPNSDMAFMIGSKDQAFIGFKDIDLTGISTVAFVASAASNYGQAGGVVEIRIGSPTGAVLGTSSEVVPTEVNLGKPRPPAIATAKIQPTNGKQDIYFVYKNPKTVSGQSLFTIINIMFQ
jgi:cytochrome c